MNSNWSYSPETLNSGQNWWFFCPMWPWNLMNDLGKQQGTSSILRQAFCIISKLSVNSNWSYSSEMPNLGQNRWFFVPCDLEILWMTLKNNRAPLLCYFKFCASFHSHWWIQTGVTVWKCPIWIKIDDFFSRVTLKFDGWNWKNNRAPLLSNIKLCASFQHHI